MITVIIIISLWFFCVCTFLVYVFFPPLCVCERRVRTRYFFNYEGNAQVGKPNAGRRAGATGFSPTPAVVYHVHFYSMYNWGSAESLEEIGKKKRQTRMFLAVCDYKLWPCDPKKYVQVERKKKAHFLILSFLAFLPGFLSSFLVLVSISFSFLWEKKMVGDI
jgi:hypothetical protein